MSVHLPLYYYTGQIVQLQNGDMIYMPLVTVSASGLVPVLPNIATQYLNGVGGWSTPAGGGSNTAGTGIIIDANSILSVSGVLFNHNNLSDIPNSTTALTNLGFVSGAFFQTINNLSELNNSTTALSNLGFSSGTFLQVSNSLSEIKNTAAALVNLSGVPTGDVSKSNLITAPCVLIGRGVNNSGSINQIWVSTGLMLTGSSLSVSGVLMGYNNLSDVPNVLTAQSNLSLSYTTLATGIYLPTGNYAITGINYHCAASGQNLILQAGTGLSTNIVLQPYNTGWVQTTGRLDLSKGLLTLPTNSVGDTMISGTMRYNGPTNNIVGFNGQREVSLNEIGWGPSILPIGCSSSQTLTVALSIRPSGLLSVPFYVPSNFLLGGLVMGTTALVGGGLNSSAIWKLYQQPMNAGNSIEATLLEVSGASGGFLPFSVQTAAAQNSAASGSPAYVGPGCYWLTLLNNSTGALAIGTLAGNSLGLNLCQTGIATGNLGPNITFTGAVSPYIAWGKTTSLVGMALKGYVFGQSANY